eukprot:4679382-Prymnesium_polylepis.1
MGGVFYALLWSWVVPPEFSDVVTIPLGEFIATIGGLYFSDVIVPDAENLSAGDRCVSECHHADRQGRLRPLARGSRGLLRERALRTQPRRVRLALVTPGATATRQPTRRAARSVSERRP